MEEGYMVKLFLEVVMLMGLRGYNIQAFKWLIDLELQNQAYIGNNEPEKVISTTNNYLANFISSYRNANFALNGADFSEVRKQFSVIFDRPSDERRTLVLFGDNIDKDESIDQTHTLTNFSRNLIGSKTNNYNKPFDRESNCTIVYVIKKAISKYTSPLFILFTDYVDVFTDQQLFTRSYDNCMQSYFVNIPEDKAKNMLSEVHLNQSTIPSVSTNDVMSKVMKFESKTANLIYRKTISSEETTDIETFVRTVR